MTFARSTAQTRRLEPSWKPWTPEPYQLRGAEFLQGQGAAVLWLDPGMRKTSIVLKAFCDMQERGEAKRMLVIAPRRVCQLVWRQEAAKWGEFKHLSFAFLHGPKKAKLLADTSDVHLINPEGVLWLAKQYANCPDKWPYDVVTFDELTKFKNSQSERSKALRGRTINGRALPNLLKRSQHRWGATGTPNPNGYMDLFGQFLMLDDGAALGRFVTHYRDSYFSVGFNGFDYDLQPGAEKRIQKRLEPYVFALDADDYLTLPELQDNIIEIELEPDAWAAYEAMRKDMVATLPEGVVEAANTAAAYTKLSQMAGGAVYMADGSVQEIHTAKLDALSDLIDEMGDRQLLIGYEFNHEKDRIKARFGNRMVFLSDARTDKQAEEIQRDWNAGKIQFLACHPASAGHGLNLQEGNAAHLCWFGPIWDLELWDQFVRRLRRSGNAAAHVVRHTLVVRNSIDELKLQGVAEKDTSQSRLKRALTTVLGGEQTEFRSQDMVMKLQRAGAAAPVETSERRVPAGWGSPGVVAAPDHQAAQVAANEQTAAVAQAIVDTDKPTEERKAPSGWGKPASAAAAPQTEEQEQRAEIREKLNPETPGEPEGNAGFSAEVIALKGTVEQGEDPVPFENSQAVVEAGTLATQAAPKATRSRAASPGSAAQVIDLDAVREALRSVLYERDNQLTTNAEVVAYEEQRHAQYVDEHNGRVLNEILHGAKAAADAVAVLSAISADAGQEAHTLLFGAIEERIKGLGYGGE